MIIGRLFFDRLINVGSDSLCLSTPRQCSMETVFFGDVLDLSVLRGGVTDEIVIDCTDTAMDAANPCEAQEPEANKFA